MIMLHVYVDCKRHLSKSLFVVGEFGGNDYNADRKSVV